MTLAMEIERMKRQVAAATTTNTAKTILLKGALSLS